MTDEWQLVPKIATAEMLGALEYGPLPLDGESWQDFYQRCWLAVLESAPTNDENERLRSAIRRALADSESGNGWGPDVTVCAYLREALGG